MKKVTEKKQRKIVRKAKKIRSIIMMALMCIMLLSAATYAWFTLSDTAKVSNLTMTVGEAKGLRVAPDNGGTPAEADWKGAISLDKIKGVLIPATFDGSSFYRPVYDDDGKVTSVAKDDQVVQLNKGITDEKKEGHYYEWTFYMESLGEDAEICLVKGENLTGNDTKKGTYVVETGTKDAKTKQNAAAAVRIAIKANDTTKIYEPNSDLTFSGEQTKAETAAGYTGKIQTNTIKQSSNGKFGSNDTSSVLFTLQKDKATKITLDIWIEGDDDQCVNQIQLDNLIGQLQFKKAS